MAIPVTMDGTWVNPSSVSLDAGELRRADAAMFAGANTGFGARGGIALHDTTSLLVSVNASDVVTVQAGSVVVPGNAVANTGPYRYALPADTTGNLTARNATNPRITIVAFRALDTDVVAGHGAYTGRIEFIDGTPAASPVAPTLPSMAVELARISVPNSGGGAASVDLSFRTFASALNAPLLITTGARLPATGLLNERARTYDAGREYVWDGAAWQPAVGDWVLLSTLGLSGTQSAGYRTPGYRLVYFDATRRYVEFRGVYSYGGSGGTAGATMWNMPVGTRPTENDILMCPSNNASGFVRIQCLTTGAVTLDIATGAGQYISLANQRYWLD